jgi:hypothetical protein
MRPKPHTQPSAMVNWSIPLQLIDQFPTAGVVINCPPFRGTINHLPPDRTYWPRPLPRPTERSRAAVISYVLATPAKSITRQKRHGLTTAKLRVSAVGGGWAAECTNFPNEVCEAALDQFHTAVVVVNGPPLKGPLITRRPRQPHWPQPLPTTNQRSDVAVISYVLATPAECITRQKRHGSTTAKLGVSSVGGTNVFYF